ncbi:MAG: carbohydrate ABC transporter permease, partial [Lachnospirales bacterium]
TNFKLFFNERSLWGSVINTFKYAILTSGIKVILAFFIAIFLTSKIKASNLIRSIVFFPNIVSTVAVGITFRSLMHPSKGLINTVITTFGFEPINFLGNPDIALYSVIATDVWKGLGVATVIYIAGIVAIDKSYYEAAEMDGATAFDKIKYITFPLCIPAMNSVIILSFIGGMRSFDLIWTMTGGGPGFATDVVASVVYKQYASGYYGLSSAGTVIIFIMIALFAYPLQRFLLSREEQ